MWGGVGRVWVAWGGVGFLVGWVFCGAGWDGVGLLLDLVGWGGCCGAVRGGAGYDTVKYGAVPKIALPYHSSSNTFNQHTFTYLWVG